MDLAGFFFIFRSGSGSGSQSEILFSLGFDSNGRFGPFSFSTFFEQPFDALQQSVFAKTKTITTGDFDEVQRTARDRFPIRPLGRALTVPNTDANHERRRVPVRPRRSSENIIRSS